MYRQDLVRISDSLKGRDHLVDFLSNALGYNTNPVPYHPNDFETPHHLAEEITAWWILSDYPGILRFQIHLIEVRNFIFYTCRDVIDSFYRKRPGYFLFIFTKDYSYVFFLAIEWCLERRPWPGHSEWPRLPKPYYRHLWVNVHSPTLNDACVLSWLKLELPDTNPRSIYERVIQALKLSSESLPEWFLPSYYNLGGSIRYQEKRKAVEEYLKYLADIQEILLGCLASESLRGADEASDYLVDLMGDQDFVRVLTQEGRGRLDHAISRLADSDALFQDGDKELCLMAVKEAVVAIEHVRLELEGSL